MFFCHKGWIVRYTAELNLEELVKLFIEKQMNQFGMKDAFVLSQGPYKDERTCRHDAKLYCVTNLL